MKRVLKIAALVLLLVVLAVVGLFAVTFMGRRALVDGYEINRVRVISDGFAGIGMIRLADGLDVKAVVPAHSGAAEGIAF
jgi:hypothetical protein